MLSMQKGKLYLIPTPLHEDSLHTIPNYVIQRIHQLDTFIVERAKTARRFIKATQPPFAIQTLTIYELGKHTPVEEWRQFLKDAEEGKDIGLMSEAGCPGVADPGAQIVQLAYEKQINVVPMVGPSSILLALMASGMNGQQFCFHGYLSPKKDQLIKELKKIEHSACVTNQTQIFIETPYRNQNIIEAAIKHLSHSTLMCIASNITSESEFIRTKTIQQWKASALPNVRKQPTIFLIGTI